MTLLSTVFCTDAELVRRFSEVAIVEWSDHDDDGIRDDDVVDDAINHATEDILMLPGERYSTAALATSELVSRWAVVLAGYYLATSRGNDASESMIREYDRLMDPKTGLLFQVANSVRDIPGLSLKADMRPAMSNRQIDRRYEHSTVRVVKVASTETKSKLPQKFAQDSAYVSD